MAASKLLQNQLKKLHQEPVEGFTVELLDDNNLFEWRVYMEGPRDTPYQSGVFQLVLTFPPTYPMEPPMLRFTSEFWHPNVYPDGKVCISILHPPVLDEMSGERPEERWLPTQSPTTVLLSVLSMLSDPNFSSPANVDASVELRRDPEAFGKRVKRLVEKATRELPARIKIPHPDTDPEERKRALERMRQASIAESMSFDEAEAVFDEDMDEPFDDDEDIGSDDNEDDAAGSEPEEEEEDEPADDPPKKGNVKGKAEAPGKNDTAKAGVAAAAAAAAVDPPKKTSPSAEPTAASASSPSKKEEKPKAKAN